MNSAVDARLAPKRSLWLALAAAVTLAVSAWTALQGDDQAPLPERGAAATPRVARTAAMGMPRQAATWPEPPRAGARPAWPAATPLGVTAWGPPASTTATLSVSAAAPVAIVPPQAPAFPYTLIGRLDDGEPRALLSGTRRSLGAKASDVIDGEWRVDSVTPQGMTLTWLPAGIKKTLTFGAS